MGHDKASLRAYWKKEHSKYSSHFAQWSESICNLIQKTADFKKAKHVGIFSGRNAEVNLLSLWQKRPTTCLFPRVSISPRALHFFPVPKLSDLVPGALGILEPGPSALNEVSLFDSQDLILVPGLAFDEFGGRIGHGMGYYDIFLSGIAKKAKKWGVAFSPQVRHERLVQEATDVTLDALVTEKGIIYF